MATLNLSNSSLSNHTCRVDLISKQKGVVLVVSLVFLIALTAVAAALMQNTTTDIKMSGASQEKVIAAQDSLSASEEVIFNEVSKLDDDSNMFALTPTAFQGEDAKFDVEVSDPHSDAEVILENPDKLELDCPPSRAPSSVGTFSCNRIRIRVITTYGRYNSNSIETNATIGQKLLKNN